MRKSVAREYYEAILVAFILALFVRTFLNLDDYDIGFDAAPLMTFRTFMTGETYKAPDARGRTVRTLVEQIESLPGVEAVFASNMVPLNGGGGGTGREPVGRVLPLLHQRQQNDR